MDKQKPIYSIEIHLESGKTLNGYVLEGSKIDNGFWFMYSKTKDMATTVSINREKIEYYQIMGVAIK